MGRKHVFEGIAKEGTKVEDYIETADGRKIGLSEIFSEFWLGQRLKITVEVLENAGGATKEAIQREEM